MFKIVRKDRRPETQYQSFQKGCDPFPGRRRENTKV